MSEIARSNADDFLRALVNQYGISVISHHPWVDERDRWFELAIALCSRCTMLSEHQVRDICLAIAGEDDAGNPFHITSAEHAENLQRRLTEQGFESDAATRATLVLTELSQALDKVSAGRLQLYLRKWFDAIAEDMEKTFSISALSRSGVRHAFRFWLQNVANAPISLTDPKIRVSTADRTAEMRELIEAADAMDLNLALLDDMVHMSIYEGSED